MAHILIVDDEEILRDLLCQILERKGHTCDQAASGVQGCKRVDICEYDLIITDVRMPEMGGMEFLRRIQKNVESRTPCMIITALADEPAIAVKAVRLACDFLSKPFEVKTIEQAVERALVLRDAWKFRLDYERRLEEKLAEQAAELEATHDGVLIGFAELLEGKDTDLADVGHAHTTGSHCQRLRFYSLILAEAMGMHDRKELRNLELGAMLHDIGKFRIPDRILHKPGRLDEDEWVEMRKHPQYGADAIEKIPFLHPAKEVVLNHHERWDGGGYPNGLAGEEIPLAARIFFVVDAFDAICEHRVYREGRDPAFALEEIRAGSGTQFDPSCVEAFERAFDDLVAARAVYNAGGASNGRSSAHAAEYPSPRALTLTLRREVAARSRHLISR